MQDGLTVSGPVTFSGTFSAAAFAIEALQVNQNLSINRHIDAGGPTPTVSAGPSIGSGGTVTISGTDTAGTVTINVGSGAGSNIFASVSFGNKFDGTPHVVITPVGAAAPNAFVSNRTASGFSISSSPGLSTGSISFDFIAID